MIGTILFYILPFLNEMIPQEMELWDFRGPVEEIHIPSLSYAEETFFIAAMPDSYESQILKEIGYNIPTPKEWKEAVRAKGYTMIHSEIRHGLAYFEDLNAIRRWLCRFPPNDVEQFVGIMQEKGWIEAEEGGIAFPYKRLVLIIGK